MNELGNFSNKSLEKLTIKIRLPYGSDFGPSAIESVTTIKIKKILSRGIFFKLLSIVHKYTSSVLEFSKAEKVFKDTVEKLSIVEEIYDGKSVFGYTGDTEYYDFVVLKNYRDQILEGFTYPSESKKLYEHVCEFGNDLIKKSNSKSWFNLGICYGYCESILALNNPDVQFYGIERTGLPKVLNRYYFPEIDNLKVFSGDVFEHFRLNNYDNGILHHARTMVLMPPSFIKKFYLAAKKAGFKYIFGVEQYGYSRETNSFYQFSFDEQESVGFRGAMYIHNYPALLKECGFEIVYIDSILTDHPHLDYRLLSFCAKAI